MSVYPSVAWNESSPAGTDAISAGDDRIREMKTQIRQVIGVDHDFPSSGQAADNGQHLRATLQEQADLGTGVVGTTILGSQTIDTRGELVYTNEDDADIQITKGATLYPSQSTTLADWSKIMGLVYPIGFVVTLGVSTNPGTLFGVGTWTAIEGKVIVGISDEAGDTAFDTLNETGGEQTHTLLAAEIPAVDGGFNTGSGVNQNKLSTVASASVAHNNLQPYIVKYVWERTS